MSRGKKPAPTPSQRKSRSNAPVTVPPAPELEQSSDAESSDPDENPEPRPPKRKAPGICERLRKRQRVRRGSKQLKTELETFKDAARWLTASHDPFIPWLQVLCTGVEEHGIVDEGTYSNVPDDDRERQVHVPNLREHLEDVIENDYLDALVQEMNNSVSDTRSQDVRAVRSFVLRWARSVLEIDDFNPPLDANDPIDKNYGWYHPQLAELLVTPIKLREFLEDPNLFCQSVLNNRPGYKINHTHFPAFFYQDLGTEASQGPQYVTARLFKGWMLAAGWVLIFIGKEALLNYVKDANSRSWTVRQTGKAWTHHMTKITYRSIAYTSLIVRHCLSASDDWRMDDGGVNKEGAFRAVIQLFEDPEYDELADWAKEIVAFWNSSLSWMLPGAENTGLDDAEDADSSLSAEDADSSLSQIKEMIRMRKDPASAAVVIGASASVTTASCATCDSREHERDNGKCNSGDNGKRDNGDNGKRNNGKRDDGKHDDGKHDDGKRDDGKRGGGKRDDGKRDDGKRDDGKRDGGKRDDGKRDGGKRDNGDNGKRNNSDNGKRNNSDNGKHDNSNNAEHDNSDNAERDNGQRDNGDNGQRDNGDNGQRDNGEYDSREQTVSEVNATGKKPRGRKPKADPQSESESAAPKTRRVGGANSLRTVMGLCPRAKVKVIQIREEDGDCVKRGFMLERAFVTQEDGHSDWGQPQEKLYISNWVVDASGRDAVIAHQAASLLGLPNQSNGGSSKRYDDNGKEEPRFGTPNTRRLYGSHLCCNSRNDSSWDGALEKPLLELEAEVEAGDEDTDVDLDPAEVEKVSMKINAIPADPMDKISIVMAKMRYERENERKLECYRQVGSRFQV
ncbi:hypothetical protein K435DRAFT_851702 [Dendrothele bispora CBS 962.96]|uniref:Uncharacterized protein n=1 Tax=Dendrothele bispora (strain CBS 962.96) TaxID=1314807 RepID=A0A4S8ML63_DENBC|nr:hypothetical protein K435DRAFT_851702 [Dendrothele bispora CBS 962.96]